MMRFWGLVLTAVLMVFSAARADSLPQRGVFTDSIPNYYSADKPEVVKKTGQGDDAEMEVRNVTVPAYEILRPSIPAPSGLAVIVCPGGGFRSLRITREGYDIAHWLNSLGHTAVVLKYRLKPYPESGPRDFPPLLDLQRLIRILRYRSRELDVNPSRIGIIGFSAGSMLAHRAAVFFDQGEPLAVDSIDRISCRPDFFVSVYGGLEREVWVDSITGACPPSFHALAADDRLIFGMSMRYLRGTRKYNVPVEMHVFPYGGHGFGLARSSPASAWTRLCETFLNTTAKTYQPKMRPEEFYSVPKEKGFHLRINVGADRYYQDDEGHLWESDSAYNVSGPVVTRGPISIANTQSDFIYRTERYSVQRFDIPVPRNGAYRVRLHFAETFDGTRSANQRVFSVFAEGEPVIEELDIYKEAGKKRNTAVVKTFPITVSDSQLTLSFKTDVGSALVNGIEVIAQ